MTDILFINTTESNELRSQINGTMILATKLLDAGFDTKILRFCDIENNRGDYYKFIENITDRILSINPKCVSFYTLWPFYHISLRIAQHIKEKNPEIITVMGGPQSSATAYATMRAMPFVDYISTGEGENTVVPFFDAIVNGNRSDVATVAGTYYREDGEIKFNHNEIGLSDLNALPHWDERLYTVDEAELESDNYFMPIDAGRGCPYSCTFCCTSLFWKRTYRLKSPQRIVEDIKYYNQNFGIKSFWFSHDAFTTNRQLVSDVCDCIIENNLDITWRCSARIDCISEELVLKMKKSGLTDIELGIETGSPRMQRITNKNLNLEKVRKMVEFLIKQNISVGLFFMYGFPEETEEDLNQTLELFYDVLDMGVKQSTMSYCRFNPNTEITNKYFGDLVLEPKIKVLTRDVFGYAEELETIKANKEIFPHFYHLNTAVRNNYQFLIYLAHLYRSFPNSLKFVRPYYKGDNLKFYKDFYNNNIDIFSGDMAALKNMIKENPVQMLTNTFKGFDENLYKRICAIIQYDFDLQTVAKSKTDMSIQKKYAFNYIEHQMKLPLEQCTDKTTEILLKKENGKFDIKVISIG